VAIVHGNGTTRSLINSNLTIKAKYSDWGRQKTGTYLLTTEI
jgi:hypothetical protein